MIVNAYAFGARSYSRVTGKHHLAVHTIAKDNENHDPKEFGDIFPEDLSGVV